MPFDLERWPRRRTFDFFRTFDRPHFSVCTRLDITALVAAGERLGDSGVTLALHHAVLTVANAQQPMRLRLAGERVLDCEVVDGSLAVLCDDDSITFAYLAFDADYTRFAAAARPRLAAARRGEVPLDPGADVSAMIHFTTLPWFDFTSFTHPRQGTGDDSVPKIAFGRRVEAGRRWSTAMAVEVHHALMDGVHVGRFVQALQARIDAFADA